ncbi:hypothetical protein EV363DRAFT_1297761 [Boletus edulis]|nr:hypothetical protein EV363DRAFT_1297761 [Boletus edulis]
MMLTDSFTDHRVPRHLSQQMLSDANFGVMDDTPDDEREELMNSNAKSRSPGLQLPSPATQHAGMSMSPQSPDTHANSLPVFFDLPPPPIDKPSGESLQMLAESCIKSPDVKDVDMADDTHVERPSTTSMDATSHSRPTPLGVCHLEHLTCTCRLRLLDQEACSREIDAIHGEVQFVHDSTEHIHEYLASMGVEGQEVYGVGLTDIALFTKRMGMDLVTHEKGLPHSLGGVSGYLRQAQLSFWVVTPEQSHRPNTLSRWLLLNDQAGLPHCLSGVSGYSRQAQLTLWPNTLSQWCVRVSQTDLTHSFCGPSHILGDDSRRITQAQRTLSVAQLTLSVARLTLSVMCWLISDRPDLLYWWRLPTDHPGLTHTLGGDSQRMTQARHTVLVARLTLSVMCQGIPDRPNSLSQWPDTQSWWFGRVSQKGLTHFIGPTFNLGGDLRQAQLTLLAVYQGISARPASLSRHYVGASQTGPTYSLGGDSQQITQA